MIEQRIARLRTFLQEHDADGVIIVQPENLRYFSAFTGGEGALVIGLDQAVLWTDSRYTEQAANQSGTWYDIKNHNGALSDSIRSSLTDMDIGVAAYEENFLTHFMYENISDGALCGFLPCDLTSLRAVKEPYELKATRKASNIADRAFAELLPYIKPGVTEKELAARLESNMLLLGSEEKSFTTIVASGKRSAMPHGTASPKVIEDGDFVTFDFGAVWEGYHSDITRTVVVGKASQAQKDFYNLILEGQKLGVSLIKAGVSRREVDYAVRNYFARYHVSQYFTHSLGHGTGLEIHEQPVLSPKSAGVLEENMIVTVEPGLYIEGKFGVRIEDSVAVTANGCEILTKTPKDLMELL
ncbi:MAG: Xaa-Pro peptidase family protein [Megasphaera sp.]|jgi:Xaa-Pro aminopeptidase|uniref:M24 family metallopeptidase n=1 Tax=Megasphaera sp. TaxID=2023260 RepID=UPI0025BB711E|nr:Xaa-Pro peptidase family protein [Megasphaera sp.]MCF0153255.1 aminopeptidase P family protein [Megasphaera sp.]MCI7600374.1 Xaa-Pro peptidase family protein [Megasphaera sp.]